MKKLALILGLVGAFNFSFAAPGDSTVTGNITISYKESTITEDQKDFIKNEIFSVIKEGYGEISEYSGFDLAIDSHINKRLTGEYIKGDKELPDFIFCINFDYFPSSNMLKEITRERIDYLKGTGLPITPDRYLIKVVEREGKAFIVVALDETYIFPG